MAISASIDPSGTCGGPVLAGFTDRLAAYARLGWETMPERLLAAGISWKVYNDPMGLIALSPLPYFRAYNDPLSTTGGPSPPAAEEQLHAGPGGNPGPAARAILMR
jgi:phospholipase C